MMLKADLESFRFAFMAQVPPESRDLTAHSNPDLLKSPRAQFHMHRILLVDDEILGTTTRAEILREFGYSVDFYHSPLAALRCDLSTFELAVVDFHMPELNGRELLLRMRALGATFPIILLTGDAEELSKEDRVLFARCIDKGTSIPSLFDAVAEVLDLNLRHTENV
jgi:CheY-like chemotaxis protein